MPHSTAEIADSSKEYAPDESSEMQTAPEVAHSEIYKRLPEADGVRLLRLYGSQSLDSPIHCDLEVVRLRDPRTPLFEALSYTWADLEGNAQLCEPIYIGYELVTLLVTKNCFSALRHLRTLHDRLLWVDAICINQVDIQERGHQVALMRDIYSTAARVLIYLGEANPGTEAAVSRLADMDRYDRSCDTGLFQILTMPYFKRIWVVQEVKNARRATVTYGNQTFHWEHLLSMVAVLNSNEESPNWPTWMYNDPTNLYQLLQDTEECQCTDPRDRIYALLGLANAPKTVQADSHGLAPKSGWEHSLPVEYTLSVQELFTGLTSYYIQRNSFDFLNHLGTPKMTKHLPSWVPDWASMKKNASKVLYVDVTMARAPLCTHQYYERRGFKPPQSRPLGWRLSKLNKRGRSKQRWTNAPKEFEQASIMSNMGCLVVEGYHIFSYSPEAREMSLMGAQSMVPLSLSTRIESAKEICPDGDCKRVHCFFIPAFDQPVLLKHHADAFYSLCGSCEVFSSQDIGCYLTPYDSHQSHDGLSDSDYDNPDSDNVDRFVSYRSVRQLVEAQSLLDNVSMERWIMTTHFLLLNLDKTKVSPFSTFQRVYTEKPWFEKLSRLREEILGMIPQQELAVLEILSENDLHVDGTHDCLFDVGGDSFKTYWVATVYNVNREWKKLNGEFETQMASWERQIQDYKVCFTNWGPISEPFRDIHGTDSERHYSFQGEAQKYIAIRLLGVTVISAAGFICRAWRFIQECVTLDIDMDWEWNRDRFWICMVTLEMVAQLQESMNHRRILRRLQASFSRPERIYIV